MNHRKNRSSAWLLIFVIICIASIPLLIIVFPLLSYNAVYETNSTTDYGNICGNFNNTKPSDFIFSFFPSEISNSFSDVTYHYKAKKGDGYAYECYLEFCIEDANTYAQFVEEYVDTNNISSFVYDETLMEYSISNILDLDWKFPNDQGGYAISEAEIGKILYSDSNHRIIFFAFGMWDGGGTDTNELDYFFNKFDIDWLEYQTNAYYSYEDQHNGLTYGERFNMNGSESFSEHDERD